MNLKSNSEQDIATTLGINNKSSIAKRLKRWFILVILVIAGVKAFDIWKPDNNTTTTQFKTQKVQRGRLTVVVSATGNLKPTNEVEVSSELSGIIKTVEVDYNKRVKIGQVLARLDTSKLDAQVSQSKAALDAAQAKLLEAQVTGEEKRHDLRRLENVQKLSNGKVTSQQDIESANADLKRAQAAEVNYKAMVAQAQATLNAIQTDLAKTIIRSPINGIVLKRSIEAGQTVAASFEAPVLFTLAEDLTKMELYVDVDEADVGKVEAEQDATFTVYAYPDRTFTARVREVRFASKTTDGVVTYETVLNVNNSEMLLRPGMTATAEITVKKIENALLVPNAALRFTPPVQDDGTPRKTGLMGKLLPRPPAQSKKQTEVTVNNRQQHVWTLQNGQLTAIPITIGATDKLMTEVTSGNITPGMEVVVETVRGVK